MMKTTEILSAENNLPKNIQSFLDTIVSEAYFANTSNTSEELKSDNTGKLYAALSTLNKLKKDNIITEYMLNEYYAILDWNLTQSRLSTFVSREQAIEQMKAVRNNNQN